MNLKEAMPSNEIMVFHGDNYNTIKLEPKLMNNGNNQEGIGIYFSNEKETAESYGKNVVSTVINIKNFVESREDASKHISLPIMIKMLQDMKKVDGEEMYFFMSDYAEIMEEDDIEPMHYKIVAKSVLDNEIRNLQITLAEIIGATHFVKLWNKYLPKIHGTYNKNSDKEIWFAIINTNYKLEKV